jgi:hypothetical protein
MQCLRQIQAENKDELFFVFALDFNLIEVNLSSPSLQAGRSQKQTHQTCFEFQGETVQWTPQLPTAKVFIVFE